MARTTGADIYEDLHRQLLDGDIRPGDRLREADLAASYGVSRTPVREALRRLESRGLVIHEANRGALVPRLDLQAVTELYVMREVLESGACAQAALHATDIEIEALGIMVHADRTRLERPDELARSNKLFHAAIHRAAHNRYLVDALHALHEAMALLGPTTMRVNGRSAEALEQHREMVRAIAARDAERAAAIARNHVRDAHRARLRLMYEQEMALNDAEQT